MASKQRSRLERHQPGIDQRLHAVGGDARHPHQDFLPPRPGKRMMRGLPHHLCTVAIREDEAGILGEDPERYGLVRRKEEPVAVEPIVRPFPVGAKILDAGLGLDDPDFTCRSDAEDIGAAVGGEHHLGQGRAVEAAQEARDTPGHMLDTAARSLGEVRSRGRGLFQKG